ncbi:MAG: serine hydrolase [Bacteroidetes bacterium]|nr:serine hydrolase [Bacteroidota bacterium]
MKGCATGYRKWNNKARWVLGYTAHLLICLSFALSSCAQTHFLQWKEDKACVKWVDSVYNQLSTEERIGQFFMVPAFTQGNQYNMDSVLAWTKSGKAGGIIFFKGLPEAEAEWTNRIQDSAKVGVMVGIDGEWGVAMRLDSVLQFPRQMTLGAINDNRLIYEMGREIGRQCKRMGIHVNFAPDIDINNNPQNPVINERSFGEDKFKVALKGIEYAHGLQDEGVLACAKHFPGHGDVSVDSHHDLPGILKSAASLDSFELYPFKVLFGNGVGSVMVAHLNIPAYDTTPNISASLSGKIATALLRDSLHYEGLVFSDAINMKGVSKYFKPGTVDSIAFMAGCDILVYSEDCTKGMEKIKMALDSGALSPELLEARVKKVLAYKYKMGLHKQQHIASENLRSDLNNTPARLLRQQIHERAITVAANLEGLLPLRDWNYKKVASLSIGNSGASNFQRHINLFAEMDFFNQASEHSEKSFASLFDTLTKYDLVIVDLHAMIRSAAKNYNVTEETVRFMDSLSARTKVVLVVFGNAYALKNFEYLPWVVCAYEENEATHLAAANALFGAEKISGKLPVTSCSTFAAGTGFPSDSIYRLKISAPEEVGIASEKLRALDDVVQRAMAAKAFPGCQLLVAKEGKVIWNKSYGNNVYEINSPVKPAQLYDLASITKVAATTLAVMKLYEDKKIDLDKTIGDYVPLPTSATIKKLKLRDVLTHQAGLKPFFMFWKETTGVHYERYYRKTPEGEFRVQVADSMFIRSDYADTMWYKMATSEVETKPKYVYSDLDFYILQKVVEHVSGESLSAFITKHFYAPMGLTHLTYNPIQRFSRDRLLPTENDSLFRRQLVWGYVHDQGAAMYGGVAGHAGLFGNSFDLAALFQMLLNHGRYNGHQLLQASTIKTFTARQSRISRRGLGFDKPEPDVSKASPCYDGVPLSVFGHTGFTGTCVWADPTNQLIYIFLSNRVYPNSDNNMLVKMNIRTELQEVIYKAIGK